MVKLIYFATGSERIRALRHRLYAIERQCVGEKLPQVPLYRPKQTLQTLPITICKEEIETARPKCCDRYKFTTSQALRDSPIPFDFNRLRSMNRRNIGSP
jgi:hypothetical protein